MGQKMSTGFLLGILVCFVLLLYHKITQNHSRPPAEYDSYTRCKTKDGWELGVYKYSPLQKLNPFPVILCHGMGGHARIWELRGQESWALQLRDAGFEVWSISLRGSGKHAPTYIDTAKGWGWTIEAHLQEDLPALLDTIEKESGSSQFHWLGHGLGGQLITLYQSEQSDRRIRSCVIMGTGLSLVGGLDGWERLSHYWPLPVFPLKRLAQSISPFVILLSWWFRRFFEHPRADKDELKQMLSHGCSNVSTPALRQWVHWTQSGKWTSFDNKIHYEDRLESFKTPVLFIAGSSDRLSPVHAVETLCKALGSSEKSITVLSTKNGSSSDYGHLDLVTSPNITADALPLVKDWFQSQS